MPYLCLAIELSDYFPARFARTMKYSPMLSHLRDTTRDLQILLLDRCVAEPVTASSCHVLGDLLPRHTLDVNCLVQSDSRPGTAPVIGENIIVRVEA